MSTNDADFERLIQENIDREERAYNAILEYGQLTGEPEEVQKSLGIPAIIPTPTEKDYERGFMKRSFVARYDAKTATEVSEDFYNNEASNLPDGIYKAVSMKWYLTNSKLPQLAGMKTTINALNVNAYLTNKASKDLPQLRDTIEIFDQFFR